MSIKDQDSDPGKDETTETSFLIKKIRKWGTLFPYSIWTSLHGLSTADIIYVCAAMVAVKYVKKSADKGYVHQFHMYLKPWPDM
jgi:hypothetical protein